MFLVLVPFASRRCEIVCLSLCAFFGCLVLVLSFFESPFSMDTNTCFDCTVLYKCAVIRHYFHNITRRSWSTIINANKLYGRSLCCAPLIVRYSHWLSCGFTIDERYMNSGKKSSQIKLRLVFFFYSFLLTASNMTHTREKRFTDDRVTQVCLCICACRWCS